MINIDYIILGLMYGWKFYFINDLEEGFYFVGNSGVWV